MPDAWRRCTLGDVMTMDIEVIEVVAAETYPLAGVFGFGRGVFSREPMAGTETSYKRLHRLREGRFVMSKLKAFEGAVAIVGPEHDGHVLSPEFPTFRLSDDLTPGFMRILCADPDFWTRLQQESSGIGGRRERVHPSRLLAIEIDLPTVAEQRRIVDLLGSVDYLIGRTVEQVAATDSVLQRHLYATPTEPTGALADHASLRSGPSWKAADESNEPIQGSQPVIGIKTTRPDGSLDPTQRAWVAGLPDSVRTVSGSSLIMIRTNGNRARIGNVYRTEPSIVGCAVSAFQILIEPNDETHSAALYWYLRSPQVQSAISQAASGSTGLGNIGIGWLKTLPVLDAADPAVMTWVETADALESLHQATLTELSAMRHLKSTLMASLLHSRHEIPSEYDLLLEDVA